ncbi:MAG: HAMP domain-containing histidine kinase [Lachnospiraceae bacterium]|nr:HAMP domain-containing histidine kinase [Lachnospiraceae bacterium]
MKKYLETPKYTRKIYSLILAVSILFILLTGFLGISLLNAQYTQELQRFSNIAGAILTEYPDAEKALLTAMQDTSGSHLGEGLAILEKYGYRDNLLMSANPYYRSLLVKFLSFLALVFFLYLVLVTLCFLRLSRNQRAQEIHLHTLIDHYLSEDYSYLTEPADSVPLFNESFTDTLLKLGNKLKMKTQELAQEQDHTKTLVTDISHQLKTPVSALKSCFSMCMEADTETERRDFLERCAFQITSLESLVSALINISRLETSLITLHPEETLLSDILMNAVNIIYEKALQKNITIEVNDSDEEDTSSLSLLLDKKWTAEAIANILDNAVKYSPAESRIVLQLHKLYDYVRIEIEDEGIGIPKAEYNQIFKRFYRGSHPMVKQSAGSGVGLYLSRRIIEEQNGTVMVKPALKQGSVFVVQLPL